MISDQALKLAEPAPLFLGYFPLTAGVQVICFFHFVFCVSCVALVSSVTSIWIEGYEVNPVLQIAIGSWCLLGVLAIAGALVGCSQRQTLPLQVYCFYLMATDVGWAYVAVSLLVTGSNCSLVQQDLETQRLGVSLSCGVVSACWFFCFLAVWSLCLFAAYTVWQLQAHLVDEEAKHLLAKEDPVFKSFHEGTHLGFSETIQRDEDHARDPQPYQWAAPRRGLQPAWGSMQPKSTGAENVWQ